MIVLALLLVVIGVTHARLEQLNSVLVNNVLYYQSVIMPSLKLETSTPYLFAGLSEKEKSYMSQYQTALGKLTAKSQLSLQKQSALQGKNFSANAVFTTKSSNITVLGAAATTECVPYGTSVTYAPIRFLGKQLRGASSVFLDIDADGKLNTDVEGTFTDIEPYNNFDRSQLFQIVTSTTDRFSGVLDGFAMRDIFTRSTGNGDVDETRMFGRFVVPELFASIKTSPATQAMPNQQSFGRIALDLTAIQSKITCAQPKDTNIGYLKIASVPDPLVPADQTPGIVGDFGRGLPGVGTTLAYHSIHIFFDGNADGIQNPWEPSVDAAQLLARQNDPTATDATKPLVLFNPNVDFTKFTAMYTQQEKSADGILLSLTGDISSFYLSPQSEVVLRPEFLNGLIPKCVGDEKPIVARTKFATMDSYVFTNSLGTAMATGGGTDKTTAGSVFPYAKSTDGASSNNNEFFGPPAMRSSNTFSVACPKDSVVGTGAFANKMSGSYNNDPSTAKVFSVRRNLCTGASGATAKLGDKIQCTFDICMNTDDNTNDGSDDEVYARANYMSFGLLVSNATMGAAKFDSRGVSSVRDYTVSADLSNFPAYKFKDTRLDGNVHKLEFTHDLPRNTITAPASHDNNRCINVKVDLLHRKCVVGGGSLLFELALIGTSVTTPTFTFGIFGASSLLQQDTVCASFTGEPSQSGDNFVDQNGGSGGSGTNNDLIADSDNTIAFLVIFLIVMLAVAICGLFYL